MLEILNFQKKFNKTISIQTLLLAVSALILGTVIAVGFQLISAWTGPSYAPGEVAPAGDKAFLDTSINPQEKAGPLTILDQFTVGSVATSANINIFGDVVVDRNIDIGGSITATGAANIAGSLDVKGGATIHSNVNIGTAIEEAILKVSGKIESPAKVYFNDVYLTGVGRWASIMELPFDKGCQEVVSGNCSGVTLNTDPEMTEEAGDEVNYVVTKVLGGGSVECCRPPKSPPEPTTFDMTIYLNLDIKGQCSGSDTYYRGEAVVTVTDGFQPISNVEVLSEWSDTTDTCETNCFDVDNCLLCKGMSGVDGIAIGIDGGVFESKSIKSSEAYGNSFCFNLNRVKDMDYEGTPYNYFCNGGGCNFGNQGHCKDVPTIVDPEINTHISSITVNYYDVYPTTYAVAWVEMKNEADALIDGVEVNGHWEDSFESVMGAAITGEEGILPIGYITGNVDLENDVEARSGIAIFVTETGIDCWRVKPKGNPKFTFIVDGVVTFGTGCPQYRPMYNEVTDPPTGYVPVIPVCEPPLMVDWRFGPEPQKYAWGENIGWLNFKSFHDEVKVWGDCLEGWVWAENIGWIHLGDGAPESCFGDPICRCDTMDYYSNTSATDYGVNNDRNGLLTGYAWGENVGWINFEGVTVDQIGTDEGQLEGYAWGENIGWINFDHADVHLQTDYLPKIYEYVGP